jgi:hypothetical protein
MALESAPVPEIQPDRGHVTAGETIGGRLVGSHGVADVALIRRERSPAREHRVACVSTVVRDTREGWQLDVPAEIPPTAEGRRCAMDYILTAKEALGDGAVATAAITVGSDGRPHLDGRGAPLPHRARRRGPARRRAHLRSRPPPPALGAGRVDGRGCVHRDVARRAALARGRAALGARHAVDGAGRVRHRPGRDVVPVPLRPAAGPAARGRGARPRVALRARRDPPRAARPRREGGAHAAVVRGRPLARRPRLSAQAPAEHAAGRSGAGAPGVRSPPHASHSS